MAFLYRIVQVLVMVVLLSGMLIIIWYAFTWTAIAVLEALGVNNSLVLEWLKTKLPKRKKK